MYARGVEEEEFWIIFRLFLYSSLGYFTDNGYVVSERLLILRMRELHARVGLNQDALKTGFKYFFH